MKRIVSTALTVFVISSLAQAQDAQSYINKATENLKTKNYQAALKNLGEAKKVVNDLLGDQLAAALPQTVGAWKLGKSDGHDMGYMNPNEISVMRTYKNADAEKKKQEEMADLPENLDPAMMMGDESPYITASVSNNMMMANEVMMAHSEENYTMGSPEEEFEAIRVKGYRATIRYNKEFKNGTVTVLAGGGLVRLEGNQLTDKNVMKQIAEAINYDTIKSILGE